MSCSLPSLIPGPAAFENWSGKPMLSYSSIRVNSLKRLLPHIAFIFLMISEEILTASPPEIPPVPRSLCDSSQAASPAGQGMARRLSDWQFWLRPCCSGHGGWNAVDSHVRGFCTLTGSPPTLSPKSPVCTVQQALSSSTQPYTATTLCDWLPSDRELLLP